MKVHLVVGQTGEYSDHQEWFVSVFDGKEDADKFCAMLNDWCKEHGVHEDDFKADWEERHKLKCPHDPAFGCDYNGVSYYVAEVEKGVAQMFQGKPITG